MQLIVSRLAEPFQGMEMVLKIGEVLTTIGIINGNKAEYRGPSILLTIDQHVVFGMSHPAVVRRLLDEGPQVLLSNKETAHTLFEHGMKASVGKVKIKNSMFITNIETFYEVKQTHKQLSIVMSANGRVGCMVQPEGSAWPVVLSCGDFIPKPVQTAQGFQVDKMYNEPKLFNLDLIRDFVTHTWR